MIHHDVIIYMTYQEQDKGTGNEGDWRKGTSAGQISYLSNDHTLLRVLHSGRDEMVASKSGQINHKH